MIAIDTNVVLRILVDDDPVQRRAAERLVAKHAPAGGVFVSNVVLAETAWALCALYKFEREEIHAMLHDLAQTAGVHFESDSLILALACAHGALPLYTFDKRLARAEHVKRL